MGENTPMGPAWKKKEKKLASWRKIYVFYIALGLNNKHTSIITVAQDKTIFPQV